MGDPKVSVIIPVYNSVDLVERALNSAFRQSLPTDLVEIIAVDDGSTDGSGELLDRLAAEHANLHVAHQSNSGGPGGPRNTGIAQATGQYLFFLDADDYLGEEALERMCAMADAHDTDVVIGKYVGINRGVPRRIFRRNLAAVSPFEGDPNPYGTLACLKLFRRELVMRHGIRFPEGLLSGEDARFTAHAYMHARAVSVVGDYDCYYWVARTDGTSAVQSGGATPQAYFASMTALLEMVDRHVEPGPVRDQILLRHFGLDILGWRFSFRYLRRTDEEQRFTFAAGRELIRRWMNPQVLAGLTTKQRMLVYCIEHDLPELLKDYIAFHSSGRSPALVVEDGRVFAAKPGFRDEHFAIPDELFEVTAELGVERGLTGLKWTGGRLAVTGHAYLTGIDSDKLDLALLLRRRGDDPIECRVPVERGPCEGTPDDGFDYGGAGFTTSLDFAAVADGKPLRDGTWDVFVEVRTGGFVKTAKLAGEVPPAEPRLAPVDGSGQPFVRAFPNPQRNLVIDVGKRPKDLGALLRLAEVSWSAPGVLRVTGQVATGIVERSELAVTAVLKRRGGDEALTSEVAIEGGPGQWTCVTELPLQQAAVGRWDLRLEFGVGDAIVKYRVRVPEDFELADPTTLAARQVTPYRTVDEALSVQITERSLLRFGRRAARKLVPRAARHWRTALRR